MPKTAIIDIGSNTFNLLISEKKKGGSRHIIFKTKVPVMLGKGGFQEKLLTPEAVNRGMAALEKYKKIIEKYGAEKIFAFATSAVRSAANGASFVEKVRYELGIEINMISGDREAELIYFGVRKAVNLGEKPCLIMDVGGGSTEFIIANAETVFWKRSYDLGVSRLLEIIDPSDPVTKNDVHKLENYLGNALKNLFIAVKDFPIQGLVGSSGSFESYAEMIVHKQNKRSSLKAATEYLFATADLMSLHAVLLASSKSERKKMKGLVKFRVDTIVMASIFVNYIIHKLRMQHIRLSTYSLREGVMESITHVTQR